MSRRSKLSNVAYIEDADENGDVVKGTETYATSVASPTKEKMNTIHPAAARRDSKVRSKDKEHTSSSSRKPVLLPPPRPSTKHSKTTPIIQSSPSSSHRKRNSHYGDEASYYGFDEAPIVMPASSSRPRAHTAQSRPSSYYGQSSRPPVSNARWHLPHHPPPPPPPPPPSFPGTSFPPQPWQAAGPVSYPLPPPPPPHPSQSDYFVNKNHHSNLAARFGRRPASAMAHRSTTAPVIGYADDYEAPYDPPVDISSMKSRRPSTSRRARQEEDRARMPPPPLPPARPLSAMPLPIRSSPFAPPPRTYDDDAFEGEGDNYQDVSPPVEYAPMLLPRSRRPSVNYTTEVAGSNSRRNSYYGGYEAPGASFEDKMRQAAMYQQEVDGGGLPLTAETLKRASKNKGPGTRSSRSSNSHEDSDWRQSATTRTTQSNSDDITIQVKGGAVLKVGGAEMQCHDGAEINISSSRVPGGIRGGSDRSSYIDVEERRPLRIERPPTRGRADSQAGSYSRTAPPYEYGSYPHDYPARSPFAPPPAGHWL